MFPGVSVHRATKLLFTASPSDFFNPATETYWTKEISTFLATVPIDGLWVDMNEISNFQSGQPTVSIVTRALLSLRPLSRQIL